MSVDFPLEEPEFGRAWSSCAGRRVALREVVLILQARCGELFVADKGDSAEEVRQLAKKVGKLEEQASNDLQAFIKESGCRRAAAKSEQEQGK